MRVWLEVLRERHPEATWVPLRSTDSLEDDPSTETAETRASFAA
jgi:hypothetical protein